MSLSNSHPVRQKLLLAACLGISAALLQSAAYGEIYKWTDAVGEIHYSQTPPPGGIKAEEIQGAAPPPGSPAEATEKLRNDVQNLEENIAKREEAAREKVKQQELTDTYERNCITARNNLTNLEQGGRVRFLTSDGEVIRLTEEQRQQRMKDTKDHIKEFCKS